MSDGDPIASVIFKGLTTFHKYPHWHERAGWTRGTFEYEGRGIADNRALFNPSPDGDYFSFREKKGLISFMPKNREQEINEDGTWKRAGRMEMKPAKWARALLHPRLARRFKDHAFAKFAERFAARELAGELDFEFVSFERGYNGDHFQHGIDSCMWGENVGPFYRLYGCKCLVATERGSGTHVGRAIYWPKVHGLDPSGPVAFLDRVYAIAPDIAEMMLNHAREQGWWTKRRQSRDSKRDFVATDGVTHYAKKCTVSRDLQGRVDFYPYLDTFTYMDESDGQLSNEENIGWAGLDHTDGDFTRGGVRCEDGETRPEDECVNIDGSWYSRDDDSIVYCEDCEYRLRDECFCCHRSFGWYPNEDGYQVEIARDETITIHRNYVDRL